MVGVSMSKKGPKGRELEELRMHLEKQDEKHDKHLQEKTTAQDAYLKISPAQPKSKAQKHYTPNRKNTTELAKTKLREIQNDMEDLKSKGHVKKHHKNLSPKSKKT